MGPTFSKHEYFLTTLFYLRLARCLKLLGNTICTIYERKLFIFSYSLTLFILLEGPGNAFFVSSFSSGVYRSCQIEKSAKKPQFWTVEVRLSAWKKSRNLKNNSKCQHRKSYELWLRVDLLGLRTTQYTLFAYNSHNNAKRFGDENEENISTMRYRFILLRVFLILHQILWSSFSRNWWRIATKISMDILGSERVELIELIKEEKD